MNRDHAAHLAVGAVLTVAGAGAAAAGAVAGDLGRVHRGATLAGLGWLAMRCGALSARLQRAEVASGAWRHLAPERRNRRPAGPASPSPVAGPAAAGEPDDHHNPGCLCRRPRPVGLDELPPAAPWRPRPHTG